MKRVLYLLVILAVVLSMGLTACGGGSGSTSSSSSNNDTDAPQEAAEALQGEAAAGQKLFAGTCATCHGPEGKGIPGLGKDMTTSKFIAERNDAELVEFIKMGRDPSDPLNTTGVAMPPKGGNPALSDEDLFDIVAYIRTIHE
jgi:mono/diheme cytochrome c family protein